MPSDGCMRQRRRVATLLRRRGHGRKSGLRGRPHRLRASLSLSLVSARSSRVACIVAHAHTRVQNQLYAQHRRRCAQHNDRTRQGGKLTQSAEPVALLGVSTGVALHDSALTQWNRIACKSPHVESPTRPTPLAPVARFAAEASPSFATYNVQQYTTHRTPHSMPAAGFATEACPSFSCRTRAPRAVASQSVAHRLNHIQHTTCILRPVRANAESRCRCGRGEPSPGADVAGVSPVPVQMWQG